ncbi:MAG: hypothetical protein P4M15_09950 [Alphaproteobacteria bacterium]|nr:hypothetical protein [Alphaproteobacteria bacterium]
MKYSVIADAPFEPFRRYVQNVERTFATSGALMLGGLQKWRRMPKLQASFKAF